MLKLSFRNQVLAGFAVSIVLVLLVGFLSVKSINQLEDDTNLVEHTQKVIKTSTNLLQQLIDAETGMRGYSATGKVIFSTLITLLYRILTLTCRICIYRSKIILYK
jgi:CHASE3 domain sensor protein